VNIKDVAKLAGVSISTVSRVINGTAKVSEEARISVEAVLKETGYRPNSLARELQQNKTYTIGVLISVSELSMSSLSQSINAIADVLKAKNYNIMLANSRFHADEELSFFNTFKEKRVDGILYFAAGFTKEHYTMLKNYQIPMVMIGQKSKYIDMPYVIHDDFHAAKTATEYLLQMGHTDIAFIGLPDYDEAAGLERKRGFQTAMEMHELQPNPQWMIEGDFSIESGYNGMKQLMEDPDHRPTAVFATTDFMAIGAMSCIRDMGLSTPEDISIIGFDDVHVAAFYNPPLTTIHSDTYAVGTKAAELLLNLLDNKSPLEMTKYIANYNLVERHSVRLLSKEKL
jgi:LacI family sucrose operon transcriptional repressor